jgi:hypothetical protein
MEADMSNVDKRNRFDEEIFSYRATKSGTVLISWQGRLVTTLNGKAAERFLTQIAGLDDRSAQLVMAKATGNFKRGNERLAQQSKKSSEPA